MGPYLSHHLSYQPKRVVARHHLIIPPYHPMVIATPTLPTWSFDSPQESGFPRRSPSHVSLYYCIIPPCTIATCSPKAMQGNHPPVISSSAPCINYPASSAPNHRWIQRLSLNFDPPFLLSPIAPQIRSWMFIYTIWRLLFFLSPSLVFHAVSMFWPAPHFQAMKVIVLQLSAVNTSPTILKR